MIPEILNSLDARWHKKDSNGGDGSMILDVLIAIVVLLIVEIVFRMISA